MSRVLTCLGCGEDVEVFELPVEFVDPARFRCLQCLDDRHVRREPQLELVDLPAPPRQETLDYNPAQARIPF